MSKKKAKSSRIEISQALIEAIEAYGSIYSLSKASGVTQGVISRFVRGERSITFETGEKLCKVLGLSLKKD